MKYDYYTLCPVCKKRRVKDGEECCWFCRPKKKTNWMRRNKARRMMKEYRYDTD